MYNRIIKNDILGGHLNQKVLVIAEVDTATIYRMLGCEVIEVDDPEKLVRELKANEKREDIGIILLSNELSKPVKQEINGIIAKSDKLISFIPTQRSKGEPVDMRKLLLKALGFG